jgi:hypothetical protein
VEVVCFRILSVPYVLIVGVSEVGYLIDTIPSWLAGISPSQAVIVTPLCTPLTTSTYEFEYVGTAWYV